MLRKWNSESRMVKQRPGQTETEVVAGPRNVRKRERKPVALLLEHALRLPARLVLIVRVLLHVERSKPLGFLYERSLVGFGEMLPLSAEAL